MRSLIVLFAIAFCAESGVILPKGPVPHLPPAELLPLPPKKVIVVETLPIIKPLPLLEKVIIEPVLKPVLVPKKVVVVPPIVPKQVVVVPPLVPKKVVVVPPLVPKQVVVVPPLVVKPLPQPVILPPVIKEQAGPCNEAGYASDLKNPSIFYRCINVGKTIQLIVFACPKGLTFNPNLSICI